MQSIPKGLKVTQLDLDNFAAFFEQLRELDVHAPGVKPSPETFEPLLKAAVLSSNHFVEVTLTLSSSETKPLSK